MGRVDQSILKVLGLGIILAAATRLGIALVRYLQVDEMQILHLAWLRVDGSVPGVDHAFPQASLLIDLLEPLWHLLGPDLKGIFVARVAIWILGLGVLAATFLWVARLTRERVAWTAVFLLSLFSSFNERSVEIRSDPFLVLCWLLAFWVLAEGRDRWRAPLVAGALAALAVAFNFKALVALPFLALSALLVNDQKTPWSARTYRLVSLALGVLLGLSLYLAYLSWRGDLDLYLVTISRNLRVASDANIRMEPGFYVFQSLKRNVAFYGLLVTGLIMMLRRWLCEHRSLHWFPPLLFSACYLWLNPTFFPYNFVDVAPFWVLPASVALVWILDRLPDPWPYFAILALVVQPAIRVGVLLQPTIGDQLAVNRFVMTVTGPDERVYDGSGVILFRRGPFHWRLHSLMLSRYYDGAFHLADQLVKWPCRLAIPSYRTGWLTRTDALSMHRMFPSPRSDLGILGWSFRPEDWAEKGVAQFPILLEGRYRLVTEGSTASFLLNGEPFPEFAELSPGIHSLHFLRQGDSPPPTVLVWWPENMASELDALPARLRLFYGFDY